MLLSLLLCVGACSTRERMDESLCVWGRGGHGCSYACPLAWGWAGGCDGVWAGGGGRGGVCEGVDMWAWAWVGSGESISGEQSWA